MYKNYNKNNDKFNINEIRIKRVACIIFVLLMSASSGRYCYQIYGVLTKDTRAGGDQTKGIELDYNFKLLSL